MNPFPAPDVSVVIPAYREASRIAAAAAEALAFFDCIRASCEVIVVDDGSDDSTGAEAERAASADARVRLISLDGHRGKGAAVRTGIRASRGARVLVIDADRAIPLAEFPAFARALEEGADLAVASKELGRRRGLVERRFLRTLMSRAFNLVVRALVVPGLSDTQAGFKLFRGDAARSLAGRCRLDGFTYDVELLALARLEGMKIVELPVHCRLTGGTNVRVMRDGVAMLADLVRIRGRLAAEVRRRGGRDA